MLSGPCQNAEWWLISNGYQPQFGQIHRVAKNPESLENSGNFFLHFAATLIQFYIPTVFVEHTLL